MSGPTSCQTILKRYQECPALMARMIERVGVEPNDVACIDGGLAWLEASTKCAFCRHVDECCDWLAGSSTIRTPFEFCANAKLFRSCGARHLLKS